MIKELISELRIKDYLYIIIIMFIVFLLYNFHTILYKSIPAINIEEFNIETKAKLNKAIPKTTKQESQFGSKLKQVGYFVNLSYNIDSIIITNQTEFLYSHYNYKRKTIDQLMSENNLDSLPILVNHKNYNRIILNLDNID